MDRRKFLKYGTIGVSGAAIGATGFYSKSASQMLTSKQTKSLDGYQHIMIPPLIEYPYSTTYRLPTFYVHQSTHMFFDEQSSTAVAMSSMLYPTTYMAPTIKLKRGDRVDFEIKNMMNEATTNHWHGMHIPGPIDGGPHQEISPHGTWEFSMNVENEASTYWYHAHTCKKTAVQVYNGHFGMLIVEDHNSEYLSRFMGLPDIYGVNDFPIMIQDKNFDKNGQQIYDTRGTNVMVGEYITVNGMTNPFISVSPGWNRFRLLNASNTRVYNLSFKDGLEFYQIASDGGFLNRPVLMKRSFLYPGERIEVMLNFENYEGGIFDMEAMTIPPVPGQDPTQPVLRFAVNQSVPVPAALPENLRVTVPQIDWEAYAASAPAVSRTLHMDRNDEETEYYINKKMFDMNVINITIPKGEWETWQVTSAFGAHPFHVHACSFIILSLNGEEPTEELKGWKDVMNPTLQHVDHDKVVSAKIMMKFDKTTHRNQESIEAGEAGAYSLEHHAPYMYHCHILEHEDLGMMGQFSVVES
ncbi:multicopper oxidase family protein [Algicola sagamiensis]|uniref:multicopper oxidase family protein n=1 Tax=Algicola sagamiensis TaxID=163869 RepID=UPI00037BE09A|nr:multicopper oxidase domain-containing protein [Algicola sagamiensis]